jgi:acyl-CoA thioesterase-2
VPSPGELPSEAEQKQARIAEAPPEAHAYILRPWPIEQRLVDRPAKNQTRAYVRARGPLVDDPNLHRCALTFASDMGALEPSVRQLGGTFFDPSYQIASLDHALWFHRPFRFDEYLLLTLESIAVGQGRGCTRGLYYDLQGRLVASLVQEGVMRKR